MMVGGKSIRQFVGGVQLSSGQRGGGGGAKSCMCWLKKKGEVKNPNPTCWKTCA